MYAPVLYHMYIVHQRLKSARGTSEDHTNQLTLAKTMFSFFKSYYVDDTGASLWLVEEVRTHG
jgi:hypothetical protein